MKDARCWLFVGCVFAGLGVVLGAFGAHSLKNHLVETSDDSAEVARRLDAWETGTRYQMYHALGLMALGLAVRRPSSAANTAGVTFIVGILVFSGCLYALALSDDRSLGAIVPLGGLSFIVGWVMFALAITKTPIAVDESAHEATH